MSNPEQEAWEDAELLPDMTSDARRWFLAERKRRGSLTPHPPAAESVPPTPSPHPSR